MKHWLIVPFSLCASCLWLQTVFGEQPTETFTQAQLRHAGLLPPVVKRFGEKPRYTKEEVLATETKKPVYFSADEIKTHFGVMAKLDPTKAHLFDQLVKKFGRKSIYSSDEVTAIEIPKVPSTDALPISSPPTSSYDTFSASAVQQHFALLHSSAPKTKASLAILEKKYPNQKFYTAAQIRDVEANGAKVVGKPMNRPETPVTFVAENETQMSQPEFLRGWQTPLVRHDWTDVLTTEDPSVNGAKSKMGDLVGATFSYGHNGKSDHDTWSTIGAVIFPWVYNPPVEPGLIPATVTLAPSASINRVSGSSTSTGDTNQLLLRMGAYAEWYEPFGHLMDDLQVRAAPVYATSTSFNGRMPGGEADFEPGWLFNNSLGNENVFKIGFKNTLLRKEPLLADSTDQSRLDYQLRVWLHVEGGDVQDVGTSFATVRGSFFRLGPTAQLRINFPTIYKGFSITGQYSYLEPVCGPINHRWLLSANATLAIISDATLHEKVSINAGYTNGGLDFTKQDVNTFTLGLSALF